MATTRELHDWLSWLIKVRILVITFLLGLELVIRNFTPTAVPIKYFLSLILFWYTLSILYAILQALGLDERLQAYTQIILDLALVTGVVYATGALDSHFLSLYLLTIIVASILLPRRGAFLIAAGGFILFATLLEGAYFGVVPRLGMQSIELRTLQAYIFINLFAFLAVAYLASHLAQSLRETGVELQDKRGELADLQVFNENIIRSMRSGLLTSDLDGRILLMNPAAEEISGLRFRDVSGLPIANVLPDFPPPQGTARREIRLRMAGKQEKYLGISVTPLRTGEGESSGYVYSFQDLTELKRLEREVAQKERMAALGRMAAAIAHEIRNPLAAIAGSVRQLVQFTAQSEAESRLMGIVSRESERLNRVVNDILSYGQEKRLQVQEANVVDLLEETLMLVEQQPSFDGKIRIEKIFPSRDVHLPMDPARMKQVFWNLCNNAMQAMQEGGLLRVDIEVDVDWVRVRIADTGVGLSEDQLEKIFEPFESNFPGGTGLGLAIVEQIVRAHQGRVRVRPTTPGAEFTVELPRRQQPLPH
ncbi:MAG: nitrogen regulation protein NR(II) [Terriglobia bacterium]